MKKPNCTSAVAPQALPCIRSLIHGLTAVATESRPFGPQKAEGRRQKLELNSPRCPDDVDVPWFCAVVVLAHPINLQREMFVEGVADTGGETIAHPDMQTPVIKKFI